MAMGLWLAKTGPEAAGWRIESAGTWAAAGEPAAQKTQQVLKARGIDLSAHRSRLVDREMLQSFNLILTMEQGHKEALRVEFPEIAKRVYLLSEMAGYTRSIVDPIGGSMVDFQETAREIEQILTKGFDKIKQLSAG